LEYRQPPVETYAELPSSTEIRCRESHPENTNFPMEVTLEGMVMDWREVQHANASFPMEVTLEGMVTDWRSAHSSNVAFLIEVMPSAIITSSAFFHSPVLWIGPLPSMKSLEPDSSKYQ